MGVDRAVRGRCVARVDSTVECRVRSRAAVSQIARTAIPFLIQDMGIAGVDARPLEVVVAVDPTGIRAAGKARHSTVKASASTAGVTRGDVLYLNAGYFLRHRTKGPRPAAEAELKAAQVTSHELTHALANRVSQRNMPRWFNEGLAVHESARYVDQVRHDAAGTADFEHRRLAPLKRDHPLPLESLAFGKLASRTFYGKRHRLCYATAFAAVRAILEAHGQPIVGALLRACGQGLPRQAKIPERRLRWNRAVRTVLGREPGALELLRDAWIAHQAAPAPVAADDDDMPGESDPDAGDGSGE